MRKTDKLQRFLFEDIDIRGEIVQLDDSWLEILSHHNYPPVIQQYLGEMMAVTVLLAATLKVEGTLSIQANSNGILNLLITECRNNLSIRAIAKYQEKKLNELEQTTQQSVKLSDLLGKKEGSLTISIEQNNGQRYQGIVAIKGNSIAAMLENHLLQSEQLKTKIILACDKKQSTGVLLQELPNKNEQHTQHWQEISLLAETLKAEELFSLSSEEIIRRLFHEYDIRQFSSEQVHFKCHCSQQKVAKMLLSLDYKEALNIIHQSEFIEVACEFCNHLYRFDELDIIEIYSKKEKPTYH